MKKYYLLILTALLLSACTDHDFIPFDDLGPSERVTPSTKDDMPWPLTEYMDTQVVPGDNFFMYCNGTYWNNTQLDADNLIKGFMSTEVAETLVKMKPNYVDTGFSQLETMLTQPVSNDELYAFLKPFYNQIDQIQSYEDAFAVAGLLTAEGVKSLFEITISSRAELTAYLKAQNPKREREYYEPFLTSDHPDYIYSNPTVSVADDDVPTATQEQINSVDELVNKCILPAIGVPEKYFGFSTNFKFWLTTPINELKAYMKLIVFRNYAALANAQGLAYINNSTSSTAKSAYAWAGTQLSDLKRYLCSRNMLEQCITPQLKAEVKDLCEEIRQVFIRRIESLDWMSYSTKTHAIKKIERIKIFVGTPDKWLVDSPDLSRCINALEAMQELYITDLKYKAASLGIKMDEDPFHFSLMTGNMSLYTINCYYTPLYNTIIIYPSYLLPPIYEANMHPAMKYGMLMTVIGHEMTHSVDATGAEYDENCEHTTWWTIQDKMDYEKLQLQLVELYNRLPILPEFSTSIVTNGEKTLNENIADLGGLEIAHDAFVNYCKNRGFKGKDLDEMERKFFQAYANHRREKYGYAYYKLYKDDVHAFDKERVNGAVMNVDRWYELYNVQWGHYLYLRPENRIHIW